MLFENFVYQDKFFDFQMFLFEQGVIQGIQIRVAHPGFTPMVRSQDPSRILSALPQGCELFIHLGAESVGVDLGQTFDEEGVFAKNSNRRTWDDWNRETIFWGLTVAREAGCRSVLHPGYGKSKTDNQAREKIIEAILPLDNGQHILLENVPPIVKGPWVEYWGFGGTPDDMSSLIQKLGQSTTPTCWGWECLIDFTHLFVTANQQLPGCDSRILYDLRSLLEGYLTLPHSNICHFSGAPNITFDCHTTNLTGNFVPLFADAFSEMKIICLEIPWNPLHAEETIRIIDGFRKKYRIQ